MSVYRTGRRCAELEQRVTDPDTGLRWRISAVGLTGGERYYWLSGNGTVYMIPGDLLHQWPGVRFVEESIER